MNTAALFLVTLYLAAVAASDNTCPKLTECDGPRKYDRNYKCMSDYNCMKGYSCCPSSCYKHKICVKTGTDVPKVKSPISKPNSIERLTAAYCPSSSCSFPAKTDIKYLCTGDDRCPDGYKCCHTKCYTHNVCRRAVHDAPEDSPVYRSEKYSPDEPENTNYESCPSKGNCDQLYAERDTAHLACYGHDSCSPGYSCCPDCKYAHSICRKSVNTTVASPMPDNFPEVEISIDENSCLVENKECELVPYKQSKNLECISNSDCPQKYSCCSDKCYTHKICKQRVTDTPQDYSRCPQVEQICNIAQNLRFSKIFQCSETLKCGLGQVCCPSSCLGYNICKDPIPIEEKVEKPGDPCSKETIGEFLYKQCPETSEKCTEPYSMRRMLELKCEDEEDCQKNMMCCYNPCAKFKICSSKFNLEALNKSVMCGNIPSMDLF